MKLFAALLLALAAGSAAAQPAEVLDLPTRPGVHDRLLVVRPAAEPAAVVVLLTGGSGRLGIYDNGSLRFDGNFLVRSRALFVQQGLLAVLVDAPSDRGDLNGDFRQGAEHMADLGAVVRWAHDKFKRPVWLVGTSRGTHSAAEAALALRGADAPDGVVLTSTVLSRGRRPGPVTARPVTEIDLRGAQMPVLVVHHQEDGCQVCDPALLPALMKQLPAGRSELLTYAGGISQGPECEAFAHHGFNGIEERVVTDIAAWIRARS